MKLAVKMAAALAVVCVVATATACGGETASSSSDSKPTPEAKFRVNASKSFAMDYGVTDAWTGDGKIQFYVSVTNVGNADGTFSFTPVRYYSNGQSNDSMMDESSIDIAAGETIKAKTDEFMYGAHGKTLERAAVRLDDGQEIDIPVVG